MKKISLWAKGHVLITRVIISFTHLLLILIAFYLSKNIQINFSFVALSVVVFILIAGRFIYPFAKRKSYALQKIILFITSTCCFLIVCFAMKHNFSFSANQNVYSAVSLPFDSTKTNAQNIKSSFSYKDYKSLSKPDKKAFRKELKKEIKIYKKELKIANRPRPTAQDALLIFLIVLCAIALLFGLSILVCGISCGGVPAAAILLTLFGMGGVGVGLYFIIRRLHRNVEKERKQNETNPESTLQQPVLLPVVI